MTNDIEFRPLTPNYFDSIEENHETQVEGDFHGHTIESVESLSQPFASATHIIDSFAFPTNRTSVPPSLDTHRIVVASPELLHHLITLTATHSELEVTNQLRKITSDYTRIAAQAAMEAHERGSNIISLEAAPFHINNASLTTIRDLVRSHAWASFYPQLSQVAHAALQNTQRISLNNLSEATDTIYKTVSLVKEITKTTDLFCKGVAPSRSEIMVEEIELGCKQAFFYDSKINPHYLEQELVSNPNLEREIKNPLTLAQKALNTADKMIKTMFLARRVFLVFKYLPNFNANSSTKQQILSNIMSWLIGIKMDAYKAPPVRSLFVIADSDDSDSSLPDLEQTEEI